MGRASVVLDLPVRLFRTSSLGHDVARAFYLALQDALLEAGAVVALRKASALAVDGPAPSAPLGALRYTYHAHACGARTWTIKAAALPGLWHMDPKGYSGWSRLATDAALQETSATFDLARVRRTIAYWHRRFVEENISKYTQPEGGGVPEPGFVFYPLQVNGDRVLQHLPVNQVEVLERLSELANGPERRVVIKRHPLCSSAAVTRMLDSLVNHPWITISDASVHSLIPASRAVLVANSGVGVEALIHGRPVFAMAASEYRHIARAINPMTQLFEVFGNADPPDERSQRQLGWLLDEELLSADRPEQIAARVAMHLADIGGVFVEETVPAITDTGQIEYSEATSLTGYREIIRRQVDDMIALALMAPDIPDQERILLHALRLGIQRDLILRRGSPDLLGRASAMYFKNGSIEYARQFANAALSRDPLNSAAHLTLARIAFKQGARDDGMAALRKAVAGPAPTAQAHFLYCRRLRMTGGDKAEALLNAEAAIALNLSLPAVWLTAAQLALACGQPDRAAAHLTEAERLAPDDPAAAKLRHNLTKYRHRSAASVAAPGKTPDTPVSRGSLETTAKNEGN